MDYEHKTHIFRYQPPANCRYWGQDSYGAVNPSDTAHLQQTISYYCNVGLFPYYTGIIPHILIAGQCDQHIPGRLSRRVLFDRKSPVYQPCKRKSSFLIAQTYLTRLQTCNTADDPVFPGTNLPNCSFLASSIKTCQAAGKIVTMSLGGATGSNGFANDSQAAAYAQTIWDLFLGGSSSTRPFGSAVLDG